MGLVEQCLGAIQASRRRKLPEDQLADGQQLCEAGDRERAAARRDVRRELQDRIRPCQRLLCRPLSDEAEWGEQSMEELRNQAERRERELTAGFGPA